MKSYTLNPFSINLTHQETLNSSKSRVSLCCCCCMCYIAKLVFFLSPFSTKSALKNPNPYSKKKKYFSKFFESQSIYRFKTGQKFELEPGRNPIGAWVETGMYLITYTRLLRDLYLALIPKNELCRGFWLIFQVKPTCFYLEYVSKPTAKFVF